MSLLIPKYLVGTWTPVGYRTPKNSEPKSAKPTSKYIRYRGKSVSNERVSKDPEIREHNYRLTEQPLSGTDPIGQMYVEGVALSPFIKGLGNVGRMLFGKAASDIAGIGVNNIISKTNDIPIKFNSQGVKSLIELYNELPDGNPLKLHIDRAIKSGKNIKSIRIFNTEGEGLRNWLRLLTSDTQAIENYINGVKRQGASGSPYYRNIYLNPEFHNNYRVISHELDHALGNPAESISENVFLFSLPKGYDLKYFTNNNNRELSARGSQIKDWLGKSEITEQDLRNASDNYVKETGLDNAMTEFFSGIKNWEEMAKWLTKYSTVFSGGNMIMNNEKRK